MGALRFVARLVFGLLGALVKLGVVLAIYALATVAGGVIGATSAPDGTTSVLLGVAAGTVLAPISLFFGFVTWLIPATVRLYAKGSDPDFELAVPKRFDAIFLVIPALLMAAGGAALLNLSVLGFGGIALLSTLSIVAIRGEAVAEISGHILVAAAEILAG